MLEDLLESKSQDGHLDKREMIESCRCKSIHERYKPENRRQMDMQKVKTAMATGETYSYCIE